MSAKRALIVDDSRSARVILGRMLEGFGLSSDSVESAEQAFEFLQNSRPDVIFMDHLMPGMDGFAAVKILKSNPETATIPVLMYTSQEGELYMGQARALGAVGVLPKTVKPVDLTRLLHQLHLLPDRRQEIAPIDAAIVNPVLRPATPPPEPDWPSQRLQDAELRNYISNSLEALARRIATDFKATVSAPPLETLPLAVVTPTKPSRRFWAAALGAAILALLAGFIYLNQRLFSALENLNAGNLQLAAQVANQQQQLSELRGAVRAAQESAAAEDATPQAVLLQTELVPYGETPFAGARLERLRSIIERLRTQNSRGLLRLDHYIGDFCLSGNSAEGYSLAMEDSLVRRCDVVGNPFEETSAAQQSSVAFANYLNTITSITGGALRVEINNAGRRAAVAYPAQSETLAAREWNRIAVLNNRVEYSFLPSE